MNSGDKDYKVDADIPIFSQDREYIDRFMEIEER